jgi:enamine deaminase RidA (YjgF/YER057c/UK114 family)
MPPPQGRYVAATRHRDMIFTAGMTPRRDGELIPKGRVISSRPLSDYRQAVELATANALVAARNLLQRNERLAAVLSVTIFIAAEPDFQSHSKFADMASDYLRDELGDLAIGARAAVGVCSLPSAAPVEVQVIFTLGN